MPITVRTLLAVPLSLLLACGSGERDPVADAKFANEQRIGREDITKRQQRDADFMVEAATGSRFAAELGQLAQRRGSSPALRAWAPQLTRDATALGDALRPVAEQKGLTLPDGLSTEQQDIISKLTSLSGPAFDGRLLEAARDYLDDARDDFDDMGDDAYDGDIRALAARYAPILKQHYQQADELHDQLKP
ncbi:DUF4142 domain-containing protein [Hymenobacter jeollabukensis]|uniref:DUF4142 domain-containing protein n=1 Tax=Hymenobacter jeollabukensis TaxID=2025313 RepID=A0A5R8WU45_9BACT|nr:DUF4142 domain-containing protein [Hymenobacter jeollabukensis]TLM95289.1 DUF4142 domain-containing protein [Hymenobacter jeollabukensis]